MTETSQFIEQTKGYIDELGEELSALERKAKDAGEKADEWSAAQVEKLKADWTQARTEMEALADQAKTEGTEAVQEAQENAQRHYEALQAAVQAYRDHLEKPAEA